MDKKYFWRAIYTDGSVLRQFADDGSENLFSDIDLSLLDVFVISSPDNLNAFQVNVSEGVISIFGQLIFFGQHDSNRLIYFRRNKRLVGMRDTVAGDTLHCFGLQATVDGSNKKLIFGYSESSGKVMFIDD